MPEAECVKIFSSIAKHLQGKKSGVCQLLSLRYAPKILAVNP